MIQLVRDALSQAEQAAQFSPDAETKVGAVLLDESYQTILSNWNGFIDGHCGTGLPNTRPHKYTYMLHAERKLLFDCARLGHATAGRIMVCTLSPCPECLRAIWQSGVREVFFKERYRRIEDSLSMSDLHVAEKVLEDDLYHWTLNIR
ncbi:hypothetical protein [Pseudobacteriovorax antillogorgiicola]|uniref:Deoxycytidylate deaminase n=1 Tax=Pseudobacteriovorax antillogorgiicola TaxID=1513793 RepID=A0A1Y6CN07_9BACT|nr:hypothetical protein [Pseudobacteriovorax antillogorgiicola]TCS44578.1 deoxycytidylate deaminase [Pseudobacteriovorax antillogorgiicola]SMF77995.1 Deoxycytidylate deaminase [Pseudobacteriovorax antillogorgiicola]